MAASGCSSGSSVYDKDRSVSESALCVYSSTSVSLRRFTCSTAPTDYPMFASLPFRCTLVSALSSANYNEPFLLLAGDIWFSLAEWRSFVGIFTYTTCPCGLSGATPIFSELRLAVSSDWDWYGEHDLPSDNCGLRLSYTSDGDLSLYELLEAASFANSSLVRHNILFCKFEIISLYLSYFSL